jgi:hypothetical protein
MFEAVDSAWDQIKSSAGTEPLAIEVARVDLANIILILDNDEERDVQRISDTAVAVMKRMRKS